MLSFTRSKWFPTSRKDFLYAVHSKKQRKIIHTILPVKFRCSRSRGASDSQHSEKISCMQCMLKSNRTLSIPFYRWNFDVHTILPVEFRCSRSRGASDSQHSEKISCMQCTENYPYHSTGEISMLLFTRSEWFPTSRKDFLYAVHAKKQRKLSIPFYRWHSDALVHAERVIPNIQKRFPVCSAC